MKTVKELKGELDLKTVHQVRHRIALIKDLLQEEGQLKRGDNNQLLVTPEGVELLRRMQDLYESGLLLPEAARLIREESFSKEGSEDLDSLYGSKEKRPKPGDRSISPAYVVQLEEENGFLKELLGEVLGTGRDEIRERGEAEDRWWEEWL